MKLELECPEFGTIVNCGSGVGFLTILYWVFISSIFIIIKCLRCIIFEQLLQVVPELEPVDGEETEGATKDASQAAPLNKKNGLSSGSFHEQSTKNGTTVTTQNKKSNDREGEILPKYNIDFLLLQIARQVGVYNAHFCNLFIQYLLY